MKLNSFLVRFFAVVFLCHFGIFTSCAVNPVTGKRELMLVSTAEEEAIGKKTDGQVVAQYGIYDDPALQAYLTEIGQKLTPHSHRSELNYTFKVVDSGIINAFAVPGGYVYFTRGIMAHLNSEAEMAGVMGHELGHIAARHTAQQMTRAQVAQFGLGIGSILSDTFRQYADIANFGVGLLFLRFSRDHERQSDRLGVEYSTKASYDAYQMANFFDTLDRMRPQDGGGIPSWLSTHPEPGDRVVAVQNLAKEWQAKYPGTSFSTNRDEYLRKIDGVVYGPDPRQGFVEANTFYHPTLKFRFPVPPDWTVNNLPTQVQMFPEGGNAAILFSIAKEKDPGSAAASFVQDSGAEVIQNNPTSINGMAATQLITDISSEQSKLRVLSYFIKMTDQVYVFHGLTAPADYSKYRSVFRHTMENFDYLRDQRILNVKPKRVRLRKVRAYDSLAKALTDLKVADEMVEKVALLNGMELEDPVPAGTTLKVVSDN